jgi:hypothetical protein
VCEIEEAGALLVRPDGVVAWRNKEGTSDVKDASRQARRGNSYRSRLVEPLSDPATEAG